MYSCKDLLDLNGGVEGKRESEEQTCSINIASISQANKSTYPLSLQVLAWVSSDPENWMATSIPV